MMHPGERPGITWWNRHRFWQLVCIEEPIMQIPPAEPEVPNLPDETNPGPVPPMSPEPHEPEPDPNPLTDPVEPGAPPPLPPARDPFPDPGETPDPNPVRSAGA